MTMPKGFGSNVTQNGKRNFNDWWNTVPADLKQKLEKEMRVINPY